METDKEKPIMKTDKELLKQNIIVELRNLISSVFFAHTEGKRQKILEATAEKIIRFLGGKWNE